MGHSLFRIYCLLAIGCFAAFVEAASSKPNIIFILADDQRNDSLGCAGHPVIQTPTIDRLAEQGVRFENAFVTTSICMASRACIFTGMTETGHGYTGGRGGNPPVNPVLAIDVDTSFPVLLKKSGYRTGFYGKQHVRFQEGDKVAMGRMFDDYEVIHRNPYFKKQPDGTLRHTAELIGDRSVGFLNQQESDQPFFLYMSFNIGHAEDRDKRPGIGHFPWPKAVDGLYEDIEPNDPRLGDPKFFDVLPEFMQESMNRDRYYWRWDTPEKYAINMRAYFRMITGMDRVIGRVFEKLEQAGLAENTIVIYSADNGYYMGDRGFAGKWSHFEQSLRVPMIIYDPRMKKDLRGRVVEPMALNIDLTATFLSMAGLDIPEKYQGRDLGPVLAKKKISDWRTDFFCEHHMNNPDIPKWRGIRGSQFTYARYFEQEPPHEFLHDLNKDPDQYENLATNPEYARILKQMRQRCEELTAEYTRPEVVAYKKQIAETQNNK
ncbi:MAG: sulfatase [Puniceicoccaceae bacterium]